MSDIQIGQEDNNICSEALRVLLDVSEKIHFFNGLSKNEISSLITDVKILTFKYGQIIFNEREKEKDFLYYLLRGKVLVSKFCHETNVKTKLIVIDQPSLFGEMMRLTGKPRNATVESVDSKTLVVAFKIKDFKEITPVSKFYKNVILELSDKINKMNDRIY